MPSRYRTHALVTERTFVMVKPDGVMRGLVGEVIKRFEQRGLKLVAIKMVEPTRAHIDAFYPKDEAWVKRLGERGLKSFEDFGLDAKEEMGTNDPMEIGKIVRKNLLDFMCIGPVVPMVFEGIQATVLGRKLIGSTSPFQAETGTIRGDFTHDTPASANIEGRSIFNIVHASEQKDEALEEIAHWFTPEELHDYDRADHVIMFGDKRDARA
jgi:nucleoside-diphosphate kinase